MAKELRQPVVRVPFVTDNGVRIVVNSYPQSIQNNRGRTVALDFNNIYTNIQLDIGEGVLNTSLISGIAELEDEQLKHDAIHHLQKDVRALCVALNSRTAYDDLLSLVFSTRKQVLNHLTQEA